MNHIVIRTGVLLLHLLLNVFIVNYFTGFDITGSWLRFILFLLLILALLYFFTIHVISYLRFLKSRSI
jgi:hypothetical protein